MDQKFEKYYALKNDPTICINFLKVLFNTKEKRFKNIDETIDINMLVDARKTNMSNKQIADMFGMSVSTLSYIVKEYDLPRRKPIGRTPRPKDLLVGEKFKKEYERK